MYEYVSLSELEASKVSVQANMVVNKDAQEYTKSLEKEKKTK